MPRTSPKLALSVSRDIPFDKLVLSQSHVRQIKAGVGIEELAEDIARRTLLQSLTVRAVVDEAGEATNIFEVPSGGRRYRALELLVKQSGWPGTRRCRASSVPRATPRRTRSSASPPTGRCASSAATCGPELPVEPGPSASADDERLRAAAFARSEEADGVTAEVGDGVDPAPEPEEDEGLRPIPTD